MTPAGGYRGTSAHDSKTNRHFEKPAGGGDARWCYTNRSKQGIEKTRGSVRAPSSSTEMGFHGRYPQGQGHRKRTKARHTTAPGRIARMHAHKNPAKRRHSLIASPQAMAFLAAPGHASLRARNYPSQHLVRSTGSAISATSLHAMNLLNADSRSSLRPLQTKASSPAGQNRGRRF